MLSFEWDSAKSRSNLRKHGVAFEAAATAFGDSLSITVADQSSLASEARFVLVGETAGGDLVVVVHTVRGETIRLISARRATRQERHMYEQS